MAGAHFLARDTVSIFLAEIVTKFRKGKSGCKELRCLRQGPCSPSLNAFAEFPESEIFFSCSLLGMI